MALNYVQLTVDLYDGSGAPIAAGSATFTPNTQLTDAGVETVLQAPLTVPFLAGSSPVIMLLGTDSTGPLPGGWQWTVTFNGVPGNPASFSFFLPFSGGSAQRLSSQAPLSAAPPAGYVSGQLIASKLYAPSVLATPTVSSPTMAAFDSTNIQTGNFTVPASGSVLVTVSAQVAPPSTQVYGVALALHGTVTPVANTVITGEVSSLNVQPFTTYRWLVSGLTPGAVLNYDLLGAVAAGSITIRAIGSASTTPTAATGGPVSITVHAV
jgi:hypothetical protein